MCGNKGIALAMPNPRPYYTSHTAPLEVDSDVRRESRSSGFVHDLCIALAHSWEPQRVFVILTAYLDESGTHGGDGTAENPASPTLVMAGMMGSAAQWVRFEDGLAKLRRAYGFNVLHMLDFKKRQGEFAGWDQVKQVSFLRDWGALIEADRIMEGVTFRLDLAAYKAEYSADRPRKPQLDTAYGLCFRSCALHCLLEAERRLGHDKRWEKARLHFVLELGHKNAGDAQRIFNEIRAESAKVGNHTPATITFAAKEDCTPLMVGDMLAHTVWSMDQVQRSEQSAPEKFFGDGTRRRSNITHITYRPGGLVNVRQALIDRVLARGRKPGALSSAPIEGPPSLAGGQSS